MGIWELGIIIYNWNKSVYNWNIYNHNGIPIIDLIALICTIGILQQLPQHSWCFFGTRIVWLKHVWDLRRFLRRNVSHSPVINGWSNDVPCL